MRRKKRERKPGEDTEQIGEERDGCSGVGVFLAKALAGWSWTGPGPQHFENPSPGNSKLLDPLSANEKENRCGRKKAPENCAMGPCHLNCLWMMSLA